MSALVILVAMLLAAAFNAARHATGPGRNSSAQVDQLSAELDRCRGLGEPAEQDQGCRTAWERARQHFFGKDQQAARP